VQVEFVGDHWHAGSAVGDVGFEVLCRAIGPVFGEELCHEWADATHVLPLFIKYSWRRSL